MGHPDYRNCRGCDRTGFELGTLSWTRLCPDCGHKILAENIDGLHFKKGMPMLRWRRGMILSAGGLLPEQLQPRS